MLANFIAFLTNNIITAVLTLIIAVLTLFIAGGRLWAALYPIYTELKNRFILNEKFSRGPYDKATIERSTRYYISPKCSNIDPAQEKELRHALTVTRDDLFSIVDNFLDYDSDRRHLIILADSGTGKTSFVLNYYVHNSHRVKSKRHQLVLVPLGVKDADEFIQSNSDQENKVILLDALDEDTKAIEDHRARIINIMDACRRFKRVIITCRTQFFPRDEEIPIETGIIRLGPRKAGEKVIYEFWKLYLSPFNDGDVIKYLRKRYPFWQHKLRKKAQAIVLKIPLLAVRPMLLAHVPDIVKSGIEIKYVHQLYSVMINAWFERETSWVQKKALKEFSEVLAVDLYANRELRGMERIPHGELLILAKKWGIDLPPWQISGRSLLNRDAQGNFKFAHRSIMEYLFIQRLLYGDEKSYRISLTDQMKRFLFEVISIHVIDKESLMNFLLDVDLIAQALTSDDTRQAIEEDETAKHFMKGMRYYTPLFKLVANDVEKISKCEDWRIPFFLNVYDRDVEINPEDGRHYAQARHHTCGYLTAASDLPGIVRPGSLKHVFANEYLRVSKYRMKGKEHLYEYIEIKFPLIVKHFLSRYGIKKFHSLIQFNESPYYYILPSTSNCDQFILRFLPLSETKYLK
jgi:hypothetical protein